MAGRRARKWDPLKETPFARDLDSNETAVNEIMFDKCKFDYLNLDDRILKGLARAGFNKLSFIQKEAIPLGRIGVDMIIKARSGSGKTCAYTCIAFDMLVSGEATQVLIVAPTREIAFQIFQVARAIGIFYEDVKVSLVTGGFRVGSDVEDIQQANIVIGTPGRLIQLIELGHLSTSSIRLLILDEVDKLFEQQMREQMAALIARLPKSKQVIAVSATLPDELKNHLQVYLNDPKMVSPTEDSFPLRNAQFYTLVPSRTNYAQKIRIVKEWIDNLAFNQLIIFVNTKESGQKIADDFQASKYNCIYMFGDLVQTERFEIFKKFHGHKSNILVTTDLFSRGVDFKDVNMIINFDIPDCKETYLHRVGRAGRFGVDCLTLTLVEEGPEKLVYLKYESALQFKATLMPAKLQGTNPWAVLDERYAKLNLTDYQRIDRALNHRRFQPPCRHWKPDPNKDLDDQVNPEPKRKVKPGRENTRRPSIVKKQGMYLTKNFFIPSYSDGREKEEKDFRDSIFELYPPEAFKEEPEYYSSSEEESDEPMPPEGWPGCCGGHIVPGTNRWLSLDEEGKPIRHKTTLPPARKAKPLAKCEENAENGVGNNSPNQNSD